MGRDFDEHEHPRWPAGTGEGGEFRDKAGGNWISRLSDSIQTAAGGGSVRTGLEAYCEECHRHVKVVGNGKLSTHNKRRGVRCPGSGKPAPTTHPEYTTPVRAARPPRKATGAVIARVPVAPAYVRYGAPKDTVDDEYALARFQAWQGQATSMNARRAVHTGTAHEVQASLSNAQESLATWERGYQSLLDSSNHVPESTLEHYRNNADDAQLRVDRFQRQLVSHELGFFGTPEFDPGNPLAYYGDRLHITDRTWHSYAALDALEQNVPPLYHKIAAEYLGAQRDGGIWIGAQKAIDLDDLQRRLQGSRPGGDWRGDVRGWSMVDGLVSDGKVMAVGHTVNSMQHLEGRRIRYGLPNYQNSTAAVHELGHVLDRALSWAKDGRYRRDASEQRLFRLVYGKVKRDGGSALSPHFRGAGGPAEVWAEGLEIWSAFRVLPGVTQTQARSAVVQKFRVSMTTAQELLGYYDRLHKDLATGARVPWLDQHVYS
jgi:hypothetical protein